MHAIRLATMKAWMFQRSSKGKEGHMQQTRGKTSCAFGESDFGSSAN